MKPFLITVVVLVLCLGWLFGEVVLDSRLVLFSNDGPYGQISAKQARLPEAADGIWADLNWLGGTAPPPSPVTVALRLITGYPSFYVLLLAVTMAAFIAGAVTRFGFRRTLWVVWWAECSVLVCAVGISLWLVCMTGELKYLGIAFGLMCLVFLGLLTFYLIHSPLAVMSGRIVPWPISNCELGFWLWLRKWRKWLAMGVPVAVFFLPQSRPLTLSDILGWALYLPILWFLGWVWFSIFEPLHPLLEETGGCEGST